MSRSMKEANKYIFEVLAKFVEDKNIERPIFADAIRYIKTNEREKEWLQKLKIQDTQRILPTFRTAYFEFEKQKYFVTIGSTTQLLTEREIIQEEELNGGIFTALIFELKIPVKQTTDVSFIENEIFYETEEEKIEYEFSQVKEFFEPIFVYKVQHDCLFIEGETKNKTTVNILKLSGFYITHNPQIMPLEFDEETLLIFQRLFLEGSKHIPFDNLSFSLVSVHWRYSFLDIYRCIERLFSVYFLQKFYEDLGIENSLSLLNFSAKLEDSIDWKPKEDIAINKLIYGPPEDAINSLKEVKNFIDSKRSDALPNELGQVIYKIRNSIVHFRPATQLEIINVIDNEHWNKLIRASLLIIEYWYHKYDKQLNR
ncbi:MAG: hypothetical protein HCA25_09215 [Dolichospermum sp. DET50]|nr:hypothetical protein [Dolichospermum sp. DET66]MBS3032455.1 hypothetical protein [Dolichospermum sp. DET67]MBS3037660.1 hypothetical protein [Dolichospermum sp. DET50]QSX69613.1 MAG: hypothetical protein EZY12_08435 [Dolichospermum sp. DET69]